MDGGEMTNACAFSPDGRLALSNSVSGTLWLWDVASGALLRTLHAHVVRNEPVPDYVIPTCLFSPDGRLALSESDGGTPRLWDVATGQPVRELRDYGGGVSASAFSPDGSLVVSALREGLVLWAVASGEPVHVLVDQLTEDGYPPATVACAFSPDGRQVLSAAQEGSVRLWDVASGRLIHPLDGHTRWVTACAFSPDGQFALSASIDRTLRLWAVATGLEAARFEADAWIMCCAFSPRAGRVVAGDNGGALHFLSVLDVGGQPALLRPLPATQPVAQPEAQPEAAPVVPATPESRGAKRRWWVFGRPRT
jgi:WD40 repeat protein